MSLFNSPTSSAPAPANSVSPAPAGSTLVPLTEEEVKRALPQHLRSAVTTSLVDTLNNISSDPIIAENIRDNFIGYSAILKEGKFKTEDYINAVAYVSYKMMGFSNQDAYIRTFPQRHANLLAKGITAKDLSSYVAAFHKGKLVNLIMEQSLVPTWVLNQDIFQKAINVQADLMQNAVSEKVRTDAANSILNHLKKPENQKLQISMETVENSGMKEMREMLTKLAGQQKTLIESGQMKTIDVGAVCSRR